MRHPLDAMASVRRPQGRGHRPIDRRTILPLAIVIALVALVASARTAWASARDSSAWASARGSGAWRMPDEASPARIERRGQSWAAEVMGALSARTEFVEILLDDVPVSESGLRPRRAGSWTRSVRLAVIAVALVSPLVVLAAALAWRDARRAEAARAQGLRELRVSEDRFRTLVRLMPQLVWVTSPDGSFTFVNERWLATHGDISKPASADVLQRLVHPDDHAAVAEAWARSLSTGEPFEGEMRLHSIVDGSYKWYVVRGVPLRNEGGVITGWLGTNTEIDSVRRMAEDLARSNAELERFAHVSSHDLQEPLRIITSFTQLLARRYRGKLDAEADEYIAFIVDGVDRMKKLIDGLLALARVGSRATQPRSFDSSEALDESLANLRGSIEAAGATVTHEQLPKIHADRAQVVQLFQNLVGNGIKFHRHGVAPVVSVTAAAVPDGYQFAVQDNGIGIPAEDHGRIFEVANRLHPATDYPGSGLGLAICRRIVERHGGCLTVMSSGHGGSTFNFTLPGVPVAAPDSR